MSETLQETHTICRSCGALFPSSRDCPSCGPIPELAEDDSLALSVQLSVLICDQCDHMMSGGVTACPMCGEPAELVDPCDLPGNRAKLDTLGDLLPEFRRLAAAVAEPLPTAAPITDEQLITYVNRNELFNDRLIGVCKEAARQIDVSDDGVRSSGTRAAMERLLEHARAMRREYDELISARAPHGFASLHLYILSAYKGILDLCLSVSEASLACSIEEVLTARREMQLALDRAAAAAHAASAELERVDPSSIAINVDHRLGTFTGRPGVYEFASRPDFAAVLIAGLQQHSTSPQLARAGLAFFHDMLSVDPESLAYEHALALYLLSAEVAATDDPLTLRRRGNLLLDLLNQAYELNPTDMTQSLLDAEEDLEQATVNLLSVIDQYRALNPEALTVEASRLTLSQSYVTLVEWVFPRLLNPMLAAKFVLGRRPKPYREIAATASGDKIHTLAQTTDPRYVVALRGIAMITRNAGAHGGVDVSGEFIHLRQTDRYGRVTEEELTDDQFVDRVRDLFMTCLALRLAVELFRINHAHTLPAPSFPTKRRTLIEAASAMIGLWDLSQANISAQMGDPTVHITATDDPGRTLREPRQFLTPAVSLGMLFRQWPLLTLSVIRSGESYCHITIPTSEAIRFSELPQEAHPYGVLRTYYLATILPEERAETASDRFNRIWLTGIARLTSARLTELQHIQRELPKSFVAYEDAAEALGRVVAQILDMLSDVPAPDAQTEISRRRLVEAMTLLRRGLRQELNSLKSRGGRTQRGIHSLIRRATSIISRFDE